MPELSAELAEQLKELDGALTVPEVAAWLKVHESTVYRQIAAGRLRSMSVSGGGKRRTGLKIPQSAVLEYLRGEQVVPGSLAAPPEVAA